MKPFGRFLVEIGIIKEEQLLAALVEQVRQSPSVAEVIYELKLLSDAQQLAIFELQNKEGLEYRSACRQLQLWTPEIEKVLTEYVQKSRPPLGQLLVIKKHATFEELTRALDEYTSANRIGVQTSKAKVATDVRPTEPVPQRLSMDRILVKDYLELFSEEKLQNMRAQVEKFASENSEEVSAKQIISQLRTLKAGALFIRASRSEKLLGSLIEHLEKTESSDKMGSPVSMASTLTNALRCLWELRESIGNDYSESLALSKDDFEISYNKILADLRLGA